MRQRYVNDPMVMEVLRLGNLALDNNSEDSDIQLPPRGDIEIIRIALDADVAQHLRGRALLAQTDVQELGMLLGVGFGNAAKTSLKAYRQLLHSHGDPVHPAYDGRFSRSGGDTYRHVCGSDMVAAFMAQDFHACAMGILHYTTFPTAFLRKCNEKFDQFLGFRTAAAQQDGNYKGALIYITSEDFCRGRTALRLHNEWKSPIFLRLLPMKIPCLPCDQVGRIVNNAELPRRTELVIRHLRFRAVPASVFSAWMGSVSLTAVERTSGGRVCVRILLH